MLVPDHASHVEASNALKYRTHQDMLTTVYPTFDAATNNIKKRTLVLTPSAATGTLQSRSSYHLCLASRSYSSQNPGAQAPCCELVGRGQYENCQGHGKFVQSNT